eukprot:1160330-Pelagomonas_calceolata.AAC.7
MHLAAHHDAAAFQTVPTYPFPNKLLFVSFLSNMAPLLQPLVPKKLKLIDCTLKDCTGLSARANLPIAFAGCMQQAPDPMSTMGATHA